MSDDVLISCEAVSKRFSRSLRSDIYYGVVDICRDLLPVRRTQASPCLRPAEFWANHDVSFSLTRGSCLGLIGHNGAGKTTLLKILNGLIKPDLGRVEITGRVGSLIALGAGFNPVLTARENIYVNGAISGLSRRQVKDRIDAIADFSELSQFLETPVRSYSSGMQVRLGFACAIHFLKPDVLLLDEVLAVGDAAFRAKCYSAVRELLRDCAVVFVSHSMPLVARVCTEAITMSEGAIVHHGDVQGAIATYNSASVPVAGQRHGLGTARIVAIEFLSPDSPASVSTVEQGGPIKICIELEVEEPLEDVIIDLVFRTLADELAAECNNFNRRSRAINLVRGLNKVTIEIAALDLNPDRYTVSSFVLCNKMLVHYDWRDNVTQLEVVGGNQCFAGYQIQAQWTVSSC